MYCDVHISQVTPQTSLYLSSSVFVKLILTSLTSSSPVTIRIKDRVMLENIKNTERIFCVYFVFPIYS